VIDPIALAPPIISLVPGPSITKISAALNLMLHWANYSVHALPKGPMHRLVSTWGSPRRVDNGRTNALQPKKKTVQLAPGDHNQFRRLPICSFAPTR
jgi:hypothetical protein